MTYGVTDLVFIHDTGVIVTVQGKTERVAYLMMNGIG
jgi:hypothetical protein